MCFQVIAASIRQLSRRLFTNASTGHHRSSPVTIKVLLCALLLSLPATTTLAQPRQGGYAATTAEVQAPLPPPPPVINNTDQRPPCRADRDRPNINCRPIPYPYRRPVITAPAPPPADVAPSEADWDGCRQEKYKQLNALRYGDTQRANHIDEWLWKNCRSYSNELRQIEQDAM